MKHIGEFINESLRIYESKKVKLDVLLKNLDKIDDWSSADNIKKLMSEYMSAGDENEFDSNHWDACVDVIGKIGDIIADLHSGSTESIDMTDLSDEVADGLEENNEEFIKNLNKKDKEGDWDVDTCFSLFNAVSSKVCKETWLI